MAAKALRGAKMQPSDRQWWPRVKAGLKFVGWETLIGFLICLLAGWSAPQLGQEGWRDFMLAGVVVVTVRLSSQRFYWLMQSSPTTNVLWHLPVAGCDIVRWARGVYFGGLWKLLPRMLVTSWAWLGFPLPALAWPQIAWNGLLLWLVMIACVMHDSPFSKLGRLIAKAWTGVLIVWGSLLLYAWWWEKSHASGQPIAEWVVALCSTLSWLLPARWAMHAAESGTELALTLLTLLSGAVLWSVFPLRAAITYDLVFPEDDGGPPDTTDEESCAPEVDTEDEPGVVLPETAASTTVDVLTAIQQARADEQPAHNRGWIEKLALRMMNDRDRKLAAIVNGGMTGWTSLWWKALRILTPLLLASFLIMTFSPPWVRETAEMWVVVLPLSAVALLAFPLSNGIPYATFSWPLGHGSMPFFAGLPLRIHDLMRLSRRITLARMTGLVVLVLPVIAAQALILDRARGIPVLCGIALSLSVFWILIRPLFIYYRLQQMSSPAHGFRFGHFMTWWLIFALGLGIVISGMLCVAFVFFSPLWLLIAAGCSQGIYALFHARARSRKVDWVVSPLPPS
jgi:hypothetical protein